MTDCLFCKIIEREIPAEIVYEDAYVVAFMDVAPTTPGHVLVVPKEHSENFLVMAPSTVRRIFDGVQAVATQVKKGMQAEGVNITMNIGAAAGQVVMHTHIHIIPRMSNDGLKPWAHIKTSPEEIKKTADKIRNGVNGKLF